MVSRREQQRLLPLFATAKAERELACVRADSAPALDVDAKPSACPKLRQYLSNLVCVTGSGAARSLYFAGFNSLFCIVSHMILSLSSSEK